MHREPAEPTEPSFEMRLQNFRAFSDTGRFRLAPLTCIVGRNSGGKTSLISSLMLLKQSITDVPISTRLTPLALAGSMCDLGTFRDVVHEHDEAAVITISFALPVSALSEWRGKQEGGPLVPLEVPRTAGRMPWGFVSYYPHEPSLPRGGQMHVSLSFSSEDPFGPSLCSMDVELEGAGRAHFARIAGAEQKQHWRGYTKGLPHRTLSLSFHRRSFFPAMEIRHRALRRLTRVMRRRVIQLAVAYESVARKLEFLLYNTEFIGPFRTPPERRYPFAGSSLAGSGPTGERSIELLITERLLNPPARRPLHDAVSFWLKHMGLAKSISIDDLARSARLFEVTLRKAGQAARANLADVGYGISQVLPVLIQGLLSRPGGMYIVQQPELHLHPDAQAALADFFIYLSCYGVRTVVETHSEYLLIRLRRRMAETSGPLSAGLEIERRLKPLPVDRNLVSIVLTEPQRGTGARVSELLLGEGFQFENLPKGFMNQAIEDRVGLLRALRGAQ